MPDIVFFQSRRLRVRGVVLWLLVAWIGGCTFYGSEQKRAIDATNLEALKKLQASSVGKGKVTNFRATSLRESALGLGARGGLAWRNQKIQGVLTKHESLLFRIFNFNALLIEPHVLPPVLIESRGNLHLAGRDLIRISDRQYEIFQQAQFVTAPKTWRDYLWMACETPSLPDVALLPKNSDERALWKRYVDEGWRAGLLQADLIFKENLSRLRRDYEGMLRYRQLLAQNMVSAPFVSEMSMGVTGGGQKMTLDDRLLRITAFPELQADPTLWKTEITPIED